MNKTAIKNFAIWARNKLRSEIAYKAGLLGISEKGIAEPLPQSTDDLQIFDIGTRQPVKLEGKTAIEQRRSLVAAIKAKRLPFAEAFDAVIEEVAYTWFNRLIAVRFMEVNDYLPSRMRVLSSDNSAKAEPDFVTSPFDTDIEFTDAEKDYIDELKDHSKSDELFQFMFIRQCNKLNEILPELFEKTNDYTELLLNVSFTDKDGVVYHLVHDIPEDDFNIEKEGQVEIIGWLYQYYNTEPKDKVFSRPSGQKIRKEDVPAATQLFTPDWIVRYMVENSLGRTYVNNLESGKWNVKLEKATAEKMGWKYYLPEAEQTPEVAAQLHNNSTFNFPHSTFLDPCMGSGHILVYAFDVFMQIYTSQGYTERDAAHKIVENNLYGLELDDRAAQLAYFAVMMKARSYDRRFLGRGIRPNLCSIKESDNINPDYLELFGELKETARKLYDEFIDAKEYGSILNLKITADELAQLEEKCNEIIDDYYENIINTIRQVGIRTDFPALLRQAKIMVSKYDVVCTNPPYMGGGFSSKLDAYIKKYYADSKSDLFAVFIEKCGAFAKASGYYAMITQHAWMFLSSYEKLRKKLQYSTTVNMAHLGARAFDEISGEVVQTTAFVNKNQHITNYLGTYARLIDGKSENEKSTMFLSGKYNYTANADNFSKIPGSPVAYWVSDVIFNLFDMDRVTNKGKAYIGMRTGNNERFLRLWFEVNNSALFLYLKSSKDALEKHAKWIPYNKGGEYRKWYGNQEYVVNWENDGKEIKDNTKLHYPELGDNLGWKISNESLYFKSHICWTDLTSRGLVFRYFPDGFIFDCSANIVISKSEDTLILLGFLNFKMVDYISKILNPTMHFKLGDFNKIPFTILNDSNSLTIINKLVEENIQLSKADWDSFETSWDFERHPLVVFKTKTGIVPINSYSIRDTYSAWKGLAETRWMALKANEEELNRIFIDIYGLQDELTPEVEDKDVTVRKADLTREIKSLISYAVGCMFGRYSLDVDGLAYAGGEWDSTKYKSFIPDEDNCIPITDTKYFDDDIVGRFCEFVKVVYGEDTLEENLDYIAQALGNKGNSSREVIRNYFLNDFYKDHCKIYQKRPIYWLFDSGKQNGFKALIYIHRYNADTIGNLRVEYLHRVQRIYESEIEREQDTIDHTTNAREKKVSENRKEKLQRQLKETKEYDEKIAHLALSRIEIDLDDVEEIS